MTDNEIIQEAQQIAEQWKDREPGDYLTVWSEPATSLDDIVTDSILKMVEDDDTAPAGYDLEQWEEERYHIRLERRAKIYQAYLQA